MPKRIQRRRTAGWRMPSGAVYVGRPSRWGNPFRADKVMYVTGPKTGQMATAADVVEMYRNKLARMPELAVTIRAELAGLDLACWCPLDQPCHADVLLEIANAQPLAEPTPSRPHVDEPRLDRPIVNVPLPA